MKIVPLLRCEDLEEAVAFYRTVLDFDLKYPGEAGNEWGVELVNGDAEILLARMDGRPRVAVYIRVADVDAIFKKYVERGLVVPQRPESPVHSGPVDQSWGWREFYVDDPGGNTLRFASPLG
jgi:catechol 2,3-dioxygenase-like lactoylglutathione lyase family enzyme